MSKKRKILIGGEWRETSESFEVKSPFTSEVLAEVSSANESETEEAIALADEAAKEMRKLPRVLKLPKVCGKSRRQSKNVKTNLPKASQTKLRSL